MYKEFPLLGERITAECARGPVYFLPNPGNLGDALIRYGTLKFFRDIGLEYKELTPRKSRWLLPVLRGGTVIYGGGGGWCSYFNHSQHLVTSLKRRFKVIVLPSTYESSYSIDNTRFFRRDQFESKTNMPGAGFCHDMAFYINDEFYDEGKGRGDGAGSFFRTDTETANRLKLPADNNDISLKGNHLSSVSGFFDEINRFSSVHTDRLHVSIAACLLKKEVHLYPNAYFKNRAVYESSMKPYFDNVHFHDECELQDAVRAQRS